MTGVVSELSPGFAETALNICVKLPAGGAAFVASTDGAGGTSVAAFSAGFPSDRSIRVNSPGLGEAGCAGGSGNEDFSTEILVNRFAKSEGGFGAGETGGAVGVVAGVGEAAGGVVSA
jgi:hypothetical protein